MCFTMPAQSICSTDVRTANSYCLQAGCATALVDHLKFSTFASLQGVYRRVLTFVNKLKLAVSQKRNETSTSVPYEVEKDSSILLIRAEQSKYFPEALAYLHSGARGLRDMPQIVGQLNLFLDRDGLLRIGGKMTRKNCKEPYFPILLPKDSHVTKLIILDMHSKLRHSGIYAVLNGLRKLFWVPKCFSVVKSTLKACIHCRRFNSRTIKLNQSPYQSIRLHPNEVPFRHIFCDYFGPYYVQYSGSKIKVWILCVCCVYTRAINLRVCLDMTTGEFLRAIQAHMYDWGLPSLVVSDLGSNLVAGGDIIANFLNDSVVCQYLRENNSSTITFEQYFKGCPKLGSLVESCVKLSKRLLAASVKNNVLPYRDFEMFVMEARHLVNKRPISFFRETLRDSENLELPEPITPESLLHGRHLISVNVIPGLQPISEEEYIPTGSYDGHKSVNDIYKKLRKVRNSLCKSYHEEYYAKLLAESVDRDDRYRPIGHMPIEPGDLVLLKEEHTKPLNYPMARVRSVVKNQLGEVTGATLVKGATGETVKRHADVLIPLLRMCECPSKAVIDVPTGGADEEPPTRGPAVNRPPRRAAALQSEKRTRAALQA